MAKYKLLDGKKIQLTDNASWNFWKLMLKNLQK